MFERLSKIRGTIGFLLPWGALVPGILFGGLDLAQVSGATAWGALSYVFLATAVAALMVENHKLRQSLARDRRATGAIEDLTTLATEGARLSEHPGSAPIILWAPGPPTPYEIQAEKDRREYDRLCTEWGQKVRGKLQLRAPEFMAEWDAAERDKRFELLRDIIRELRGRL